MRAYIGSAEGMADGYGVATVRAAGLHCQICGPILPGKYRNAQERIGGKW